MPKTLQPNEHMFYIFQVSDLFSRVWPSCYNPLLFAEIVDSDPNCADWAARGECEANPDWMLPNCQLSCKKDDDEASEGKYTWVRDVEPSGMTF